MPFIKYVDKKFSAEKRELISRAAARAADMANQGYDMTVRQLYYFFVKQNLIPNKEESYKMVINLVRDARRAGLLDWNHIVDRTRGAKGPQHWTSVGAFMNAAAGSYDVNWWKNQKNHVEVWVEKDALIGIFAKACQPWKCPILSCRGYVSDSEVWKSSQRLMRLAQTKKRVVVLQLTDHDPSGIDMHRDIKERIEMFSDGCSKIEVRRIALTMAQIEEVQAPPNPAKKKDSRYKAYFDQYGDESWELDALEPSYIADLIAAHFKKLVDKKEWEKSAEERDKGREKVYQLAEKLDAGDEVQSSPEEDEDY